MKKSQFPRIIPWLIFTALAFLVFMTLARFVFFYHFKVSEVTFSQNLEAFILGLRFDLRLVCALVLFPFLIAQLKWKKTGTSRLNIANIVTVLLAAGIMVVLLLFMKKGHATPGTLWFVGGIFLLIFIWLFSTGNCNPFENKTSSLIFKIYFLLVSLLVVIFYVIDFQHYDYLHQRLNASVINYTEDAKISANMVWETYPVLSMLLIIILVSLALYVFNIQTFKVLQKRKYQNGFIFKLITGIVFALILGLGIFGRLNQYPLRWSDAFTFEDDFKANLSLNPFQSFLSTMEFRNSTFDLEKVKEYYPLMTQYLKIDTPDINTLNYQRKYPYPDTAQTPNVVVVICESFSTYKSTMGGNPLNTTPYFNEMCQNGIFFDRCFTPAYGTARGVWATITGIPDVEYPNTASRNPSYVDQYSIISDYKDYDKFYFIGGSFSWANMRGLLTNNIADLNLYEEENFKSATVDVWGISDKRLFLESNNVLKEQKKPFFAVIQTSNNHRPYTIPDEDMAEFTLETHPPDTLEKYGFQSEEEFNAFRYMDYTFKKFIETAKKEPYFNNTIFVFVGDHGIKGQTGDMFPKAWETQSLTAMHVPLLFYAPGILQPAKYDNTCSQLDILPSVTALAKVSFENKTLGKNLFDTTGREVRFRNNAFLFDPGIKSIGMVTDQYSYTHNLLSGQKEFYSSRDNFPIPSTPQTEKDRKDLETLADAYYETARYMLYNNHKKSNPNN